MKMVLLHKAGGSTSLFPVDRIIEVEAHASEDLGVGLFAAIVLDTLQGPMVVPVQEPYDLVQLKLSELDPK